MAEESLTNDETNTTTIEEPSGIAPSNNFLGLLPPPYSMSTLKTSISSYPTSSYTNNHIPIVSMNTNHTSTYNYRPNSAVFHDTNHLNSSSSYSTSNSSSYRSIAKPPIFHQTREKEKLELSTLNDKFADYVEKVRYLEAQNKKVQMENSLLVEKQQNHCQRIKTMFESELSQLKELIEKLFKDKNAIVYSSKEAQNGLVPLRQRLNQTFKECDSSKYETEKVERQLSSIEGDIMMFKRRLAHQDDEHSQWKQIITHIQRLLLQAKNETHNENLTRTTCEQTVKQLRVEIGKLRDEQQQKLKDVKQNTFQIGNNSTNDRAHMFKSELSSAIRKIRQDFERDNDQRRNELYLKFSQTYDTIARENPDIGHLFLNEREQERIKQEEDRVRVEIQRVKTDINQLKQKNAELKLRTRELQFNLEMTVDENTRFEKMQQNEIEQLKLKQERVTKDYDDVISKQTSLEKEIETYRNLLEGTMKTVVDTITDEYNANTNNQTKTNPSPSVTQTNNYSSNRAPRSVSVDRNPSSSYLSRINGYTNGGTNSYSRYLSPRYGNKESNSEPVVIEIQTTEIGPSTSPPPLDGIMISKSAGDLSVKNNEETTDEPTTVETNETENGSSPTSNRPPTILQTRRN